MGFMGGPGKRKMAEIIRNILHEVCSSHVPSLWRVYVFTFHSCSFLAAEDIGAKATKTRAEKWKSRWQNFPHRKQQARCFIISSSEIQAPGWLAWSIQLHLKPSGYSLVGEFVDDLLCFQITSKNRAASSNRSWLDSSSTWGPVSVLFAVSAMRAVESAPWEPGKKNTPNPFATKSLSLRSIMGQKIAWRIYCKDGLWYFRFFPIIGLYRTVASRAFSPAGTRQLLWRLVKMLGSPMWSWPFGWVWCMMFQLETINLSHPQMHWWISHKHFFVVKSFVNKQIVANSLHEFVS